MQKATLIARVAQETGTSKRVTRQVIDKMLDIIADELQNGEKVVLTRFGTFQMRTRRSRRGVNPQTGKEMTIPEMQTPGFSASNSLRERVAQQQMSQENAR
jgi:nucleoid DNA-binding protein